jgi:hypothetical protein
MATVVDIEAKINYEIDWRTNEISIVKTIPFLFGFSVCQQEVLKKHTIPIFYSLWEGFVVEVFSIYTREINDLKLSKDKICINMLVHGIDIKHKLKQVRTDFEKQILFIQELSTYLDGDIEIPVNVPTESNVNYKVINNLCRRYNLQPLPEVPYKKWLDRLLFFRNKLSHGEHSIPVNQTEIDEMSLTVISSMHEISSRILDGFQEKSYLKP